jgi:catechol 2,3-dioxygenase-like lactoylglutathione lyase family enzyme
MFRRIHHISFTVSNLDRSIPFYRDVLGFRFIHDVERENLPSYDQILGHADVKLRIAAFALPGETDITLELMQFRNPAPTVRPQDFTYVATPHVAYVVDDIDAEYVRIRAAGATFVSPPAEIRRDGKYIGKAVFLRDPDGILIEPMELPQ